MSAIGQKAKCSNCLRSLLFLQKRSSIRALLCRLRRDDPPKDAPGLVEAEWHADPANEYDGQTAQVGTVCGTLLGNAGIWPGADLELF